MTGGYGPIATTFKLTSTSYSTLWQQTVARWQAGHCCYWSCDDKAFCYNSTHTNSGDTGYILVNDDYTFQSKNGVTQGCCYIDVTKGHRILQFTLQKYSGTSWSTIGTLTKTPSDPDFVVFNPSNDLIFIGSSTSSVNKVYVYSVNWNTGANSLLYTFNIPTDHMYFGSNNGSQVIGLVGFNRDRTIVWNRKTTPAIGSLTSSETVSTIDIQSTRLYNITDTTAIEANILKGKTAYTTAGKVTGTMTNRGYLNITPTDNIQTLSSGYISGGTINAMDITTSSEYDICNELANQIIGTTMPYIPLEYIQSTGTQWIDTKYVPNDNTRFEITLSNSTSSETVIFGTGAYNSNQDLLVSQGNSYRWYYPAGTFYQITTNITSKCTITCYRGTTTYNGTTISSSTALNSATNTENLYICKCTGSTAYGRYRLYRFKVYESNVLKRDFVPVLDHKGIACLYDNISETFFYNGGTGEFTAGPITEREAYTTLEYVESASLNPDDSIFTGITPSSTIKFQTKLMPKVVSGGSIIGVSGGATGEEKHFRLFNYNETYYLDYGSGEGGNRISGGSFPVGVTKELEVGNRYVKDLTTGSNIISGNSVSAFSYNDLEISILSCRIYYLKIWKDGVLVADLIPIRKYDDKLGLLNRVNYEIISVNSNWTAGPVITE